MVQKWYKINANISRANFQANYFSEKKDINVKVSFSNGEIANKKALISTNFVVILTGREKLDKGDYLNTASLVILDSNIKTEDVESELIKFKIFDEDTIKEIETNPNGSKYPMSIFTFHEDGKLEDIKLPDNMDKYNADSIIELIKNVIPKLTRNRNEDISNGLEIKEKKNNQVKTIIEIQAPAKSNKIKYAIAIIIGIVITAAISVLLVGHFKFNWFKSETYKINANISRANFQANYFSEKKDINVKVSFSNGEIADKKALISTNFVVILTGREKLDKGDYLNTASLVILDSNIKTEDVESELTKFKIFDEDIIKEIETNPNGSKYPISIFIFHEDGKL